MNVRVKIDEKTWEIVAGKLDTNLKFLDENVTKLQNWIQTKKYPDILDRQCLRNFLLLNKLNISKTKTKITNYFSIRIKLRKIYKEVNPKLSYCKNFHQIWYMVGYPVLTHDFNRIGYFKPKNIELLDQFEPLDALKLFISAQEMRLRHDILYRDIFVLDLSGCKPSLALKISPNLLYKTLLVYEGVFSLRMKATYIINMPSLFRKILQLLKLVMKKKLFERIVVLDSVEDLKNYIDLTFIPKDYGGHGYSFEELEECVDHAFRDCQDLFDSLDKIKVEDDICGEVQKSFAKLEID